MQYTIFISHSSKDTPIVQFITSQLQHYGLTPITSKDVHPKEFPQYLSDTVKTSIQQSHCVVVLLTKNGVNSNWVHQEIGYVLDKKPLIPIVENGIPPSQLAFLQGVEYIPLHWGDINRSISKLVSWTTQLKAEKQEQNEKLKIIGLVILVGLSLWWLSQQE